MLTHALVYVCHVRTHTGIHTCLRTRWHAANMGITDYTQALSAQGMALDYVCRLSTIHVRQQNNRQTIIKSPLYFASTPKAKLKAQ